MLIYMPTLMMNNFITRMWILGLLNSGYFIISKLRISGTQKMA